MRRILLTRKLQRICARIVMLSSGMCALRWLVELFDVLLMSVFFDRTGSGLLLTCCGNEERKNIASDLSGVVQYRRALSSYLIVQRYYVLIRAWWDLQTSMWDHLWGLTVVKWVLIPQVPLSRWRWEFLTYIYRRI